MKAVRSQEGGVAVVEVDEPPGVEDGELLDMRATSVCASDLSYIRFGSTNILGHELAGVRSDGTPVVVEAIYGCLDCAQCRSGAYNLCPTHGQRALGMFADGGMVGAVPRPGRTPGPAPGPGLDLRDASIVEPASVSWHALRLADTGPGKRVAVVGAGALGLLAVAGALSDGRRGRGARGTPSPSAGRPANASGRTSGRPGTYDVVIEAAGSEAEPGPLRPAGRARPPRLPSSGCTTDRSR